MVVVSGTELKSGRSVRPLPSAGAEHAAARARAKARVEPETVERRIGPHRIDWVTKYAQIRDASVSKRSIQRGVAGAMWSS